MRPRKRRAVIGSHLMGWSTLLVLGRILGCLLLGSGAVVAGTHPNVLMIVVDDHVRWIPTRNVPEAEATARGRGGRP